MSATRELLTRRRTVSRGLRNTFLWLGIGLPGLLGLFIIVYAIMTAHAIREVQKMTWGMLKPPDRSIVCRNEITRSCAQEAAKRIQVPVGWMLPPAGYRLQWLAASGDLKGPKRHGIAFESLTSGRVDLELDTPPGDYWRAVDYKLVGTYVEVGTVVSAYRLLILSEPDPTTLTLRWTHRGTQYQLSGSPHFIFGRPELDPAEFAAWVPSVQYARPPKGSSAR